MTAVNTTNDQAKPSSVERDALVKQLESQMRGMRLVTSGRADDVLAQLHCVHEIDQKYTAEQKFWKGWMIGSGIAFAISIVASFMTMGYGLIVAVPFGCCFALCAVMHNVKGQLNVPDRQHRIPEQLLTYLKTDIPPDRPVSLEIDFRHYRQTEFQTGKTGGWFTTIRTSTYEVPWLKLSGQLYDGSKFRLKVSACTKRKEKSKRKRTKVTETFRDKYNLSLAVKPNSYPGLKKFNKLMTAAQPPQGMTAPRVAVKGNSVSVQGVTRSRKNQSVAGVGSNSKDGLPYTNAHTGLQLFLACYHCLGQCRTV